MCHGDPVVLDQWVCCPFHMFHQSIDRVDIGVGQPTSQFWAWVVGCWVGRLSFSSSSSFREVSVLKLPLVAHSIGVHSKEQGRFYCSQDLRVWSLSRFTPTLHSYGMDQLCCFVQAGREPSLLIAAGWHLREEGSALLLSPPQG